MKRFAAMHDWPLLMFRAVTASFAVPAVSNAVTALAIGLVLSAPLLGDEAPATGRTAHTLLGLMYVNWLLGHAILLHALPAGASLVLFLVGVTWIGETVAYVVGSTVGRRRLALLDQTTDGRVSGQPLKVERRCG